jgi:hypothetical protein
MNSLRIVVAAFIAMSVFHSCDARTQSAYDFSARAGVLRSVRLRFNRSVVRSSEGRMNTDRTRGMRGLALFATILQGTH